MRVLAWVLAASALVPAGSCVAQTESPPPTSQEHKPKQHQGVVSGTAYCADTNAPARLAEIAVVSASATGLSETHSGVTDLEGRFVVRNIPDGNYYVSAILPGYVDPLAGMTGTRLKAMSAEKRKAFDAQNLVTVSAKQVARVSLRLERGAEIDGTVLYDDGSPAISLQVTVTPKDSTESKETEDAIPTVESFTEAFRRTTDDHGRFRIVGLAAGKYLVGATVPAFSADTASQNPFEFVIQSSFFGALVVYAGGSLRASNATLIKVGAGEMDSGVDITIPLSSLHSIHGNVILKSTGQAPPAAMLQLLYADNQELTRTVIAPDGEFDISNVPEGAYILRAVASPVPIPTLGEGEAVGIGVFAREGNDGSPSSSKLEGAAEIPLLVKGDINQVTISVPDPHAPRVPVISSAPDPGADEMKMVVPQ